MKCLRSVERQECWQFLMTGKKSIKKKKSLRFGSFTWQSAMRLRHTLKGNNSFGPIFSVRFACYICVKCIGYYCDNNIVKRMKFWRSTTGAYAIYASVIYLHSIKRCFHKPHKPSAPRTFTMTWVSFFFQPLLFVLSRSCQICINRKMF